MSPEASGRSRLTGSTHAVGTWWQPAEVGREPLGRRALDTGVVLYRTTDGTPVALEDRCAHRPYPLSLGASRATTSSPAGFVYDAKGFCVHVPTQSEVPAGARVLAFPVHEDGVFVWAWLGEPSLAALRPPPVTASLNDPGWATIGDEWETKLSLLLHENFADITHVAVVDPYIAPPVLRSSPRRSRWRSPKPQSRFLERTSLPRSLHGKRSFSGCRPTRNTSSRNRAPS